MKQIYYLIKILIICLAIFIVQPIQYRKRTNKLRKLADHSKRIMKKKKQFQETVSALMVMNNMYTDKNDIIEKAQQAKDGSQSAQNMFKEIKNNDLRKTEVFNNFQMMFPSDITSQLPEAMEKGMSMQTTIQSCKNEIEAGLEQRKNQFLGKDKQALEKIITAKFNLVRPTLDKMIKTQLNSYQLVAQSAADIVNHIDSYMPFSSYFKTKDGNSQVSQMIIDNIGQGSKILDLNFDFKYDFILEKLNFVFHPDQILQIFTSHIFKDLLQSVFANVLSPLGLISGFTNPYLLTLKILTVAVQIANSYLEEQINKMQNYLEFGPYHKFNEFMILKNLQCELSMNYYKMVQDQLLITYFSIQAMNQQPVSKVSALVELTKEPQTEEVVNKLVQKLRDLDDQYRKVFLQRCQDDFQETWNIKQYIEQYKKKVDEWNNNINKDYGTENKIETKLYDKYILMINKESEFLTEQFYDGYPVDNQKKQDCVFLPIYFQSEQFFVGDAAANLDKDIFNSILQDNNLYKQSNYQSIADKIPKIISKSKQIESDIVKKTGKINIEEAKQKAKNEQSVIGSIWSFFTAVYDTVDNYINGKNGLNLKLDSKIDEILKNIKTKNGYLKQDQTNEFINKYPYLINYNEGITQFLNQKFMVKHQSKLINQFKDKFQAMAKKESTKDLSKYTLFIKATDIFSGSEMLEQFYTIHIQVFLSILQFSSIAKEKTKQYLAFHPHFFEIFQLGQQMMLLAVEHIIIQSIMYDNYNLIHCSESGADAKSCKLDYDLQKVKDIMDRFVKDMNIEFQQLSQFDNIEKNKNGLLYKFIKEKTYYDDLKYLQSNSDFTKKSTSMCFELLLLTKRLGSKFYQTSKSLLDFFLFYYERDPQISKEYKQRGTNYEGFVASMGRRMRGFTIDLVSSVYKGFKFITNPKQMYDNLIQKGVLGLFIGLKNLFSNSKNMKELAAAIADTNYIGVSIDNQVQQKNYEVMLDKCSLLDNLLGFYQDFSNLDIYSEIRKDLQINDKEPLPAYDVQKLNLYMGQMNTENDIVKDIRIIKKKNQQNKYLGILDEELDNLNSINIGLANKVREQYIQNGYIFYDHTKQDSNSNLYKFMQQNVYSQISTTMINVMDVYICYTCNIFKKIKQVQFIDFQYENIDGYLADLKNQDTRQNVYMQLVTLSGQRDEQQRLIMKIIYEDAGNPMLYGDEKVPDFKRMTEFKVIYDYFEEKNLGFVKEVLEKTEQEANKDVDSVNKDEENSNKEDTSMYELKKRKVILDKISEFGLKDCKRYAISNFKVNQRMKSDSKQDTTLKPIQISGRKQTKAIDSVVRDKNYEEYFKLQNTDGLSFIGASDQKYSAIYQLTFQDNIEFKYNQQLYYSVGGQLSKGFFQNWLFGASIAKQFLDNMKTIQTQVRNNVKAQDDIISVMTHEEVVQQGKKNHKMTIRVVQVNGYDGIQESEFEADNLEPVYIFTKNQIMLASYQATIITKAEIETSKVIFQDKYKEAFKDNVMKGVDDGYSSRFFFTKYENDDSINIKHELVNDHFKYKVYKKGEDGYDPEEEVQNRNIIVQMAYNADTKSNVVLPINYDDEFYQQLFTLGFSIVTSNIVYDFSQKLPAKPEDDPNTKKLEEDIISTQFTKLSDNKHYIRIFKRNLMKLPNILELIQIEMKKTKGSKKRLRKIDRIKKKQYNSIERAQYYLKKLKKVSQVNQ